MTGPVETGPDETQPDETGVMRAALAGIISGGTGWNDDWNHDWNDDRNWPRIEALVRELPDGPEGSAIRAWKQDFRDVSDRPGRMAPAVAVRELEAALRKDLGELGELKLAHGQYIVDVPTGEILGERERPLRTLRGQPRRIGRNKEWAVWVPSQAGGDAEPGDLVEIRSKSGRTRTRTITQIINSTKGGQNVRAK